MAQPSEQSYLGLPPSYSRPPYNPPQYLLSSTGLSRDELVTQYEAFIQSLQHVEIAPELVFERFIGNLKDIFNTALTKQHAYHTSALEDWRSEKMTLEADLARATAAAKLAEKVSLVTTPAPRMIPAVIPLVEPVIDHIYLQFWYTSGGSKNHIHLAATSVPIPYGLSGCWAAMPHIRTSTDYGSYDTRMDLLITEKTLKFMITHIVRFKKPFPTPPTVLVWLTGLGAKSGARVAVKATANNVTESEFSLQITNGGLDPLGSVGVAWAVWPEAPGVWGQETAKVGSVSTVAAGARRVTNLNTEGNVPVKWVQFASLCAVDIVLCGGVWMNVELVADSSSYGLQGTKWTMSAGPAGSKVYSARIVYTFR